MNISIIIEKLEELMIEKGDIQISCDFRFHDDDLYYDDELNCMFGE